MEFDNVLADESKDFEVLGELTVFSSEDGHTEAGTFKSIKAALEWVVERPDKKNSFMIPIAGASIVGYLDGDVGQETLVLSTPLRSGRSPRAFYGHHAVSTDYESFLSISVPLTLDIQDIFEGGNAFLRMTKGSSVPSLDFCINPGPHTYDELSEAFPKILKRMNAVLNDLLNGLTDNRREGDTLPL